MPHNIDVDDLTALVMNEEWPCLQALRKYPALIQFITNPTREQIEAATGVDNQFFTKDSEEQTDGSTT